MHPGAVQDSPSVAAVTQGRGERLLGVMLVGNTILRLGGREREGPICQVRTHSLHQP